MKKESLKRKWKFIEKILESIGEDHIDEYSAQCAYYTILSFIPFIILLITLIQYTNIDQETLFNAISKIIPSSMNEIVLGIVKEVYSKSVGTISISIIFIIFMAGNGLVALTKGLHSVFGINDKKSNSIIYLKIKSIIETIIFIIIITVGLTALVFGSSLISIIQTHFGGLKNYTIISSIVTEIIFIIATFIIFLILYTYMPKRKTKIKTQIPGAIFGAIALNIVSYVFSKYLDIFKGFSITYGSLTTLMLIMIWIYACFFTIFLGAEINKILKMGN